MVDTKRYIDWINMGDKDYNGAKILYKHDADYGLVCFHCQQAVEKYFKGYLIYKTGILQEGHNILKLCKKTIEFENKLEKYIKDCTFLNTFYIETRYPAEDMLIVSNEDVEECLRIVEEIKTLINKLMTTE